jgi:glucose-1-phosphate cytidylyltransferase
MQAVILAGGLGTRLSEETVTKPKPMVEIGGKPILWHIMKIYAAHGVTDFIICCGYRGYQIKEYFGNYKLHNADVTYDFRRGVTQYHQSRAEPWRITLVDTGETSMTGGRLLAVREFIQGEHFCFTYGDGVGDIDISSLIKFHKSHGKLATLTAAFPPGRFGALDIDDIEVTNFQEKPKGDGGRVNGGFFVLSTDVIDLIDGPDCVWEEGPLSKLAEAGDLAAYRHDGFWQPMDTLRDKVVLEQLWQSRSAPWKIWEGDYE